jgi:hypothetical protein
MRADGTPDAYGEAREVFGRNKNSTTFNCIIIYTAPTFTKEGTYRTPPRVTVLHNGVLLQNNTTIQREKRFL